MSTMDFFGAQWRRSSFSSGSGNTNCVEVAVAGQRMALRDSKNTAESVLALPVSAWQALLAATR